MFHGASPIGTSAHQGTRSRATVCDGKDVLHGGNGADRFDINYGVSALASADMIFDWDAEEDHINFYLDGTASNSVEMISATARTLKQAEVQAGGVPSNDRFTYNFINNDDADVGFLLAELDRNGTFETGITLRGAGDADDMNWSHIDWL